MSVFSNTMRTVKYLILHKPTQEESVKDTMSFFKDKKELDYPYVLVGSDCPRRDEAIYVMSTNKKVRQTLNWINKNIVFKLTTDNFKTIDVKLRIAVDMINKLEYEEVIDPVLASYLWDNLTRNVLDTQSELNSEDLPF